MCVCAQHLGRATDSPADLEILYDAKRCEMWVLYFLNDFLKSLGIEVLLN